MTSNDKTRPPATRGTTSTVTTATSRPPWSSPDAAMTLTSTSTSPTAVTATAARLAQAAVRRLRWVLACTGLFTALLIPGTAFAYVKPIGSESDLGPTSPSGVPPAAATHPAASGSSLTAVIGFAALALVVVGLVILAQRVGRRRRHTHTAVLTS